MAPPDPNNAPERPRTRSQTRALLNTLAVEPVAPAPQPTNARTNRFRTKSSGTTTTTRAKPLEAAPVRARAKSSAAVNRSAAAKAKAVVASLRAPLKKAKTTAIRRVKSSTATNGRVAATSEPPSFIPDPVTPDPKTPAAPAVPVPVAEATSPVIPRIDRSVPQSEPSPKVSTKRATTTHTMSQSDASPMKNNTNWVNIAGLPAQKAIIKDELGEIPCVDAAHAKTLYKELVSDRTIKKFLAKTPLYDTDASCWVEIPNVPEEEEELYPGLCNLITEIIANLGDANGTREVLNTSKVHLQHEDNDSHYSQPDISIKATGPSFCLPNSKPNAKNTEVGFSNVASVFDAKTDEASDEIGSHMQQLAIYNRQIFIQQGNRIFVRSLIITETKVRLLHYDRSGAYYTDYINYHKDPYTFIRLVLGLTSTDESVLGLDTRIQWKVVDGRKVSGTLTTVDNEDNEVVYDLIMDEPPFVRYTVCGRGTVCWNAKDKDGNRVLIKDSWRTDGRQPETFYLDLAKGIKGAVQILGAEDELWQTKDFRPHNPLLVQQNRTLLRITLKAYGPPISYFTSELQVVTALRDAIKAHQRMLAALVLHRDISINNILLGCPDDPNESAGILIDLDMAIKVETKDRQIASARTGTRLYQSIAVLGSYLKLTVIQDYLDDLESFFYVLCDIIYGFSAPGQRLSHTGRPSFFNEWESSNAAAAANAKASFLGYLPELPPSYWSAPVVKLFNKFRRYLDPITKEKHEVSLIKDSLERRDAAYELSSLSDDHYTAILKMFDEAIAALKAQASLPKPAPAPAPQPATAMPVPARRSIKRASDDGDGVTEHAAKKTRTASGRSGLCRPVEAQNETIEGDNMDQDD